MEFIDWFTLGLIIAVSLVFIVAAICFCYSSNTSCIAILCGRRKAALARLVFDTYGGEEGAGGRCAICLGEYEGGERHATISDCNHRFHALCIETWIQHNSTCPLCRHDLV